MWWTLKLCVYFFVIGFLLDFTTFPEFLYWESKGYSVDENRIIGVFIHIPFLFKPLFSFRINNLDRNQVNKLLLYTSLANCGLNFVSSVSDDFVIILGTLILCEMFMMIMLICLEYHMVKDVSAVSISNVSRLFGRSIGQFISLFQKDQVDLPELFLVSSAIQICFTVCLFFFRVDSPIKDEHIVTMDSILDENVQEEPINLQIYEPAPSCFQKICSCFVKDKKPVSSLSWFLFIATSIPAYMEVLTYDLVSVKKFPTSFFSVFTLGDGLGAMLAVGCFLYVRDVNKKQTSKLCFFYIMIKIVIHMSVIYGITETEMNNTQILFLWGWIHLTTSFADEGLYNLFLMDTTKKSEGSVFYLAKCQFIQTLGMIINFILTTFNMCTLGLDRKDYSSMNDYVFIVVVFNVLALLTVLYV